MLKNIILLTQNVGDYQIDNLVLLVLGRAPMLKNIIGTLDTKCWRLSDL